MATVKDTVLAYIQTEIFPNQRVGYDTPLITGLGANSLTMAGVKTYLETHYRIRIPDEIATREAFDSVEKITRMLNTLGVR